VLGEVVFRQAGEDGLERYRLVEDDLVVGQQQGGHRDVEFGVAKYRAEGAERLALASDGVLQPSVSASERGDAPGGPGVVRVAVVVGRNCA